MKYSFDSQQSVVSSSYYYYVTVLVLKGKKVAFESSTIRTSGVSSSPTVLETE